MKREEEEGGKTRAIVGEKKGKRVGGLEEGDNKPNQDYGQTRPLLHALHYQKYVDAEHYIHMCDSPS